ncbi:hypothetical protein [Enterococcus casseliflavus]|uniref:hypothetical protein n=1 Tax=Enterococcus casseliflavus TaxID=37734 RepID=UPI00325A6652
MNEKTKKKIVKLLVLANGTSGYGAMSALAKVYDLVLQNNLDEKDVLKYNQEDRSGKMIDMIMYEG